MSSYNWGAYAERNMGIGAVSYVNAEGAVIRDVPAGTVMVRSGDDLALLSDDPPGTMAFTGDGAHLWAKNADGTWKDWSAAASAADN